MDLVLTTEGILRSVKSFSYVLSVDFGGLGTYGRLLFDPKI